MIFVGSSSEARNTAQLFCNELGEEAFAIPWWSAPEFGGMSATLDSLLRAVERYDFAVFILTPDDSIVSRGEKGTSARDNVLFEAGLFLGQLGRDRVQIYVQESPKAPIKVPSDLSGIIMPRFMADNATALTATINRATSEFRNEIRRLGKMQRRVKLIEAWSFELERRRFSVTLGSGLLDAIRYKAEDKAFFLAARRRDPDIDAQDDEHLAVSTLRRLPFAGQQLVIAAGPSGMEAVRSDDVVEGYLLWVARGADLSNAKSLDQFLNEGAELLESKAVRVA